MMHVETVALGPDESYAVVNSEGSCFWSGVIPKGLEKIFTKRRHNEDITTIAFTENDFVVGFADGSWEANVDYDTMRSLKSVGRLETFAFGPDESYIAVGSRSVKYWGISDEAERMILKTSKLLRHAALGPDGAFFLEFEDGRAYWAGDLNPDLNKVLGSRKFNINKVFLAPDTDNYFALLNDNSYIWSCSQDFSNTLETNGITINPETIFFSVSEIPSVFDDGRPIDETADDLEDEVITPFDIPAITVVEYKNHMYTLDNRRLWAFQKADVPNIPVVLKEAKGYSLRRQLGKVDGWDVDVVDVSKSKHRRGSRSKSRKASAKRSLSRKRASLRDRRSRSRSRSRSASRRRSRKDSDSSDSESSSSESSSSSSSSSSGSSSDSSDSESDLSTSSSSDSSSYSSSSSLSS